MRRRLNRPKSNSFCRSDPILRIEQLEDRIQLSTVTWIATGGGLWSTPANWSTGTVPTASDDVVIGTIAGGATITHSTGTDAVLSVTSGTNLSLTGGALTVNGNLQMTGSATLTLSGGTLANANVSGTSFVLTSTEGTLDAVTVGSPLNLTANGAKATVRNGLTLNGVATLGQNARLNFDGTQTLGGSGSIVLQNTTGNALVTIADGMTLTIGASMTIQGGGRQNSGTNSWIGPNGANDVSVVNFGSINANLTGDSGIVLQSSGAGSFLNRGTLTTSGGTIYAGWPADPGSRFSNLGTITVNTGTLRFDGTYSASSFGTIVRNGGTVVLSGILNTTAQAPLTLNASTGSWTAIDLQMTGPTINMSDAAKLIVRSAGFNSSVTVNGDLDLSAFSSVLTSATLTLNGTLTIGTGSVVYFNNNTTIKGNATVNLNGGTFATYSGGDGISSFFTIGPNVTIRGGGNASSGSGYIGSFNIGGNDSVSIVNQGTIIADIPGKIITIAIQGAGKITNTGVLRANGGTLLVDGKFTRSDLGTVVNDNGVIGIKGTLENTNSVLTLDDASGSWTVYVEGTIKGGTVATSGAAQLLVYAGKLDGVTVNGTLTVDANLTIANGLTLNGSARVFGGIYTTANQTIRGNGVIVSNPDFGFQLGGILTIDSGITVRGVDINVSTPIIVKGAVIADIPGGNIRFHNAVTVANSGALSATNGGQLIFDRSLAIGSQSTLSVSPTSNILFFGGLSLTTTNPAQFDPKGTLRFVGPGNPSSTTPQPLEVTSVDFGNGITGLANNSAYGTLFVENNTNNYLRLVDQFRNSSSSIPEAVYVNTLIVDAGCTLDLNGLHLYARAKQINGTILNGTVTMIPDSGPLSMSTPTPGEISTAGQIDEWTVFARAGKWLTVQLNPGTTGSPTPVTPALNWAKVEVLDPNNNLIASATNTSAGGVLAALAQSLSVDGVYKIRVRAEAGHASSVGNYLVSAWDSTPNVRPLNVNRSTSGSLPTPYSVNQWTFAAAANTQMQFKLLSTSTSGLVFGLTGPNGFVGFTNLSSSSTLVNLPTTGVYTLTSQGSAGATGSFTFEMAQTSQIALPLSTPYAGTLAASGHAQLFRVEMPSAQVLSIDLSDTNASHHTEVYARLGSPPTRETFDYGSAGAGSSHNLFIPSASQGSWYVMVYGENVPQVGAFSLMAQAGAAKVLSSFPRNAGNAAPAVLTIAGAGFVPGTTVALVDGNGTTYAPTSSSIDGYSQISATFAVGLPAGVYSVRATRGITSDTLAAALTVTAGGQARLDTQLILPGVLGRNTVDTLYLEYANTGDLAMPAPLLSLQSADVDGSDRPILIKPGSCKTSIRPVFRRGRARAS